MDEVGQNERILQRHSCRARVGVCICSFRARERIHTHIYFHALCRGLLLTRIYSLLMAHNVCIQIAIGLPGYREQGH